MRSSHVGSSSDLALAINSAQPLVINDFTYDINTPRQETRHQIARVNAFKRFGTKSKLSAQYDFQQNNRLEFDLRRDSDDKRPSIDLELRTHSLTADFEYRPDNSWSLTSGLLGRAQTNFPDPITDVRRLIPDYDRTDLAIYTTAVKTTDSWTFEGGLRYDYNYIDAQKFYRTSFWDSRGYEAEFGDWVIERFDTQLLVNAEYDFHNFSATAGIGYDFSDDFNLTVNVARATRAPNPSELFSDGLHQSASRIELGDIRFEQERSTKVGIALSRKQNKLQFTLSPFANYISDFLLIEPTGSEQTLRGNFQVWEYRQTDARLLGVDWDAQYSVTDQVLITQQFSLVKGLDTSTETPLINMPPARLGHSVQFKKPEWKQFVCTLESQYAFRQNEFPDTNFEVFVPAQNENVLVDVSTPPAAYHLINLRSEMTFDINNRSKLQLSLAANNVFNTSYRDYLNRFRYFADDLGRNVLLQIQLTY